MDYEASFEAKLRRDLEAIGAKAQAAKRRLADGIAGVRPPSETSVVAPLPAAPPVAPEQFPPRTGPAVTFDNIDDDDMAVWEEPT